MSSGTEPDNESRLVAFLRSVVARQLPLESETVRFLIVSIGEIVLTHHLLTSGGFTEANPVARYFFFSWGIRGMVYFKFTMVAFVAVIVQIIARKRIETARNCSTSRLLWYLSCSFTAYFSI